VGFSILHVNGDRILQYVSFFLPSWQLAAILSAIRYRYIILSLRTEANTGCGKLTSFFEYEMPYEKGS
jgi:hypothetical protein